jgi:hypothetical protein
VLLEAKAVDGAITHVGDAIGHSGAPESFVEIERVLDRNVQLVAQLAEIRHPQRQDGGKGEIELARAHVGEVGVAERRVGQPREHVARARPAEVEHGLRGGEVVDRDSAAGGDVALDRRAIAHAQCTSGDEVEAVFREPGDRDIGLDAAAFVAKLRVDDGANRPIEIVASEALQQRECVGAAHFEFGERAHVDDGGTLAHGAVLVADRLERRPASERWHVDRPRSGLAEPVGPLPAELVAVDGAEFEQRRVQRTAPRAAPASGSWFGQATW